MKAVWYEKQGPASQVLTVGEMPDPHAGPGEVRIRIAAVQASTQAISRSGKIRSVPAWRIHG